MGLRAFAGVSVCSIYRVIQEKMSIFWEVIELVALEEGGVLMNVSLILSGLTR